VLPDGRFTVKSRVFVISSGGIETARLLLLSEKKNGVALGNEHDLVGRFFMLHIEYAGDEIIANDPNQDFSFQTGENGAIHKRLGANHRFVSYISLSDETRRKHNLPAIRFRYRYPRSPELDVLWRILYRTGSKSAMVRDLGRAIRKAPDLVIYVARRVIYGRNKPQLPLTAIPIRYTSEQMPNPDSRIGLGTDLDVFGLRKVKVDWQLTDEDHRGMTTGNRLLAEELERSGYGTLKTTIPELGKEWPGDMRGDQHHMGTARMHKDPRQGVTDENCRVHGTDNLYVASCALFPTGGTFNPTLTILTLAIRLADHIKERLKAEP
jgi:choline dehydrogenase-like flavoprotein